MMETNSKKKYISCNLIEHGFDTNIDAINFCCRSSSSGGGFKPLISNYHGEPVDWDKFFEIKNECRSRMKSGDIIEECKGCLYLEEKEWDDENYISYINFNHGMICNCSCIYCYLEKIKGSQPTYSALPIIKDMIAKNILRTGGHITIAGGEPTVDPDFEEILDTFIDFGMNPIRVLTNGIIYNKAIEKGLKMGVVSTAISVDSGTKETYYKVKKVDCFDKVWENLNKYSEAKKYPHGVKAKYIIIPKINDEKNEIDAFFKKIKITSISEVAVDIELFWFNKNQNNIPDPVYKTLSYFIEKAKEYGLGVETVDRAAILAKNL